MSLQDQNMHDNIQPDVFNSRDQEFNNIPSIFHDCSEDIKVTFKRRTTRIMRGKQYPRQDAEIVEPSDPKPKSTATCVDHYGEEVQRSDDLSVSLSNSKNTLPYQYLQQMNQNLNIPISQTDGDQHSVYQRSEKSKEPSIKEVICSLDRMSKTVELLVASQDRVDQNMEKINQNMEKINQNMEKINQNMENVNLNMMKMNQNMENINSNMENINQNMEKIMKLIFLGIQMAIHDQKARDEMNKIFGDQNDGVQ
eukprot:403339445